MTVVFLDTNVFMHYKPINEIDWLGILEDKHIEIVVARVVLRELDKHKDSHNRGYLRERARRRLHQLEQWGDTAEIRSGVVVRLLPKLELPNDTKDLDRDQPDDQLLLALLWYREQHASTSVVLISHDVGPRIAAKALGIAVKALDESLRLQEPPDPLKQELEEVKRENRLLKSAKPKLRLGFRYGSEFKDHVSLQITEPPPRDLEAIERQTEALRKRYPHHPTAAPADPPVPGVGFASALEGLLRVSEHDIRDYNERLDDFIIAYRRTLMVREDIRRSRALTSCLEIHLINDGTQPGDSIDVHMHFPDGFLLLEEAELPELPEFPTPPSKPRTPIDQPAMPGLASHMASLMPNARDYPDLTALNAFGVRGNVSDPDIERGDSYNVKVNVRRIKHATNEPLPTLCIAFESFSAAASFKIDYELRADNLPSAESGQLNIAVKKNTQATSTAS